MNRELTPDEIRKFYELQKRMEQATVECINQLAVMKRAAKQMQIISIVLIVLALLNIASWYFR